MSDTLQCQSLSNLQKSGYTYKSLSLETDCGTRHVGQIKRKKFPIYLLIFHVLHACVVSFAQLT